MLDDPVHHRGPARAAAALLARGEAVPHHPRVRDGLHRRRHAVDHLGGGREADMGPGRPGPEPHVDGGALARWSPREARPGGLGGRAAPGAARGLPGRRARVRDGPVPPSELLAAHRSAARRVAPPVLSGRRPTPTGARGRSPGAPGRLGTSCATGTPPAASRSWTSGTGSAAAAVGSFRGNTQRALSCPARTHGIAIPKTNRLSKIKLPSRSTVPAAAA